MYLFLNAVSKNSLLILFDNNRKIIDLENISILLQESSKLSPIIDNFLKKNNLLYSEIKNIVVVNWPGSFTWVRTISLVVNTLSYIYKNIELTPISYFDLFKTYPIVKLSSKRDLFVKKSKNNIIEIVKNEEFLVYLVDNNIKEVYWDEFVVDSTINFNGSINYEEIIKELELKNHKQIEAYYVKKPSLN